MSASTKMLSARQIPPRRKLIGRVSESVARLMDCSGLARRMFSHRSQLRILCYHGVCADNLALEPWMPSYFVTASQFAQHMRLARRFGRLVHLPDVLAGDGLDLELSEPMIAVTFDDVPACTFRHAQPILDELGIKASFFISTANVASGRLFDADVLRLLRVVPGLAGEEQPTALANLIAHPEGYKRMPCAQQRLLMDATERAVRDQANDDVLMTLSPMNWNQTTHLAVAGHDVGAHTVDHVILGRQSDAIRRQQIRTSVLEIEARLGRPVLGFAYPNGGPGDFGHQDEGTLWELGVRYALSTRTGSAHHQDRFAVPRIGIGMGHSRQKFAMELSGLLDKRRQRQQGWI